MPAQTESAKGTECLELVALGFQGGKGENENHICFYSECVSPPSHPGKHSKGILRRKF